LSGAADDRPLDQHRVHCLAEIATNEKALDRNRATVTRDADLGEMHALRVDHVFGREASVSRELAASAERDLGYLERGWSVRRVEHHDPITGNGKAVGCRLQ
jgi:hypothetical protein